MASTLSPSGLQIIAGTDVENAFPAVNDANMAILNTAVFWQSGTLSAKPAASSVTPGTRYFCTDSGAELVAVGGVWVWPFASTEAPGVEKYYAGASHPADPDGVQRWHTEDGPALGRTAYAALFTAIGTSYGAGDGSTTFNLPDRRGRTIVAAGAGAGLTSRSVGATGGEETHQLINTEVGQTTEALFGNAGATAYALTPGSPVVAHNNMQPYGVSTIAIKIL